MDQRLRHRSARPDAIGADVPPRLRPARPRVAGQPCGTAARRPLLVCFSHLRWDFVWQRPQHLLTRAARTYDVLVLEEPTEGDEAEARLDLSARSPGITIAVPVLLPGRTARQQVADQRRLLDRHLLADGREPALLWYYTPMAMPFSRHVSGGLAVYDNMDELSAFRGASPAMLAHEADLMARADLVFTGGQSLYEAKRGRHRDITAFPSSIDAPHFGAARTARGPEPDDQAAIPRPRIGFFGVIDERMDLDLVAGVARLRPDWQLVMIGPVVKIDPATLPQAPNLHWLGPKPYGELPAYLAGWDVGFMPFALNESTRYISPTKTPEYLAAGLPLVSTAIRDVVRPYGRKGLVEIAGTPRSAVGRIARVMARPPAPWLAAVDDHLAGCSWDRTWAAMDAKIAAARSAGARSA